MDPKELPQRDRLHASAWIVGGFVIGGLLCVLFSDPMTNVFARPREGFDPERFMFPWHEPYRFEAADLLWPLGFLAPFLLIHHAYPRRWAYNAAGLFWSVPLVMLGLPACREVWDVFSITVLLGLIWLTRLALVRIAHNHWRRRVLGVYADGLDAPDGSNSPGAFPRR